MNVFSSVWNRSLFRSAASAPGQLCHCWSVQEKHIVNFLKLMVTQKERGVRPYRLCCWVFVEERINSKQCFMYRGISTHFNLKTKHNRIVYPTPTCAQCSRLFLTSNMFISSISARVGALSRTRGRDDGRGPNSDTDRSMHEVDLMLRRQVWARQGREPNAERRQGTCKSDVNVFTISALVTYCYTTLRHKYFLL